MEWEELVAAAAAISWTVSIATVRPDGGPHVAVVAPGFTPGSLWFATNRTSRKYRNLQAEPRVAFHWPVGTGTGPGELIASGRARAHDSPRERAELWAAGVLPYDPGQFFGSPDNDAMVFVEAELDGARLLGPDFVARRWRRTA